MAHATRKDWRQPYRKSRVFDQSCRNHGGCPWCERNRRFGDLKRAPADEKDQIRVHLVDDATVR